jgi:hypothetical protein
MKHFIVVKLKSMDVPIRGQIAVPTAFLHSHLVEAWGRTWDETQVEWVGGSPDARGAAAGSGHKLLHPSAWYGYGTAYTAERQAEHRRKAAARRAEEASGMAEAWGRLVKRKTPKM